MTPIQIVGGGSDQALFVPAARAYRNTNQAIAAANFSELLFDKEDFDNAGIHSTVTNTGRMVAPKAGVYEVTFQYALFQGTSSTTGLNQAVITKNGNNFNSVRYGMEPNGEGIVQISATMLLEAGDSIGCVVYNASASIRNVSAAEATMVWLGSGLPNAEENYDWGIVTSPPSAAKLGDYCSLKVREDSEKPWKLWRLQKIEEAGELPWAKIGGPPLSVETAASAELTSKTLTSLTGGPEITTPVKGEYEIEAAVESFGGATNIYMTYKIGATAGDLADGVQQSNGGVAVVNGTRRQRKTLAASTTLLAQYESESGAAVFVLRRRLTIDPTRVG